MCMMIYVGSDNELPLIECRDEDSVIYVEKLDVTLSSDDCFAKENLKKEHKYYVGSWQGCGCGFSFDCSNELYNEENNKRGKQSVESLFEYLRANIENDNCEILSFWAGKGISEPNDVIDLKNFTLGDSFSFLEGQHITVHIK